MPFDRSKCFTFFEQMGKHVKGTTCRYCGFMGLVQHPVVMFGNMFHEREYVLRDPLNPYGVAIGMHYFGVPYEYARTWALAAGERDRGAILELVLFDGGFWRLFQDTVDGPPVPR